MFTWQRNEVNKIDSAEMKNAGSADDKDTIAILNLEINYLWKTKYK